MRTNKKIAVIAASAVAAIAVGTGAWAYVTSTGTGSGTATASAAQNTVTLSATATITDLDTPAPIVIKGTSSAPNRRIGAITVTVSSAPAGCDKTKFVVSQDPAITYTGFTFTDTAEQPIPAGLRITLQNDPDANQTSCLGGAVNLSVTA